MSTVAEIEKAIEKLAPEQWWEIRRWMDQRGPRPSEAEPRAGAMPDFLGRQRALFQGRVLDDSQNVLDDLRADRR